MNRTAQEIGDELYGLAPSDFTAARDTYVAEAKTAGNRALATELAAFKRPSIAAGLVNLLALRRPEAVGRLIELGRSIREAQGNVTPIQLRDLSAQRRTELDSVVALAAALAAERGDPAPSRAVLTEVESTFAAAMADDGAADLVRRGRTLKALSYSGFGQLSADASVFASGQPTARPARPATAPSAPTDGGAAQATEKATEKAGEKAAREAAAEQAAAERAERLAAAEERAETGRRHLSESASVEAEAEAKVRQLSDQITELRNELEVAQRDARAARQARLAAERALASADRLLRRQS